MQVRNLETRTNSDVVQVTKLAQTLAVLFCFIGKYNNLQPTNSQSKSTDSFNSSSLSPRPSTASSLASCRPTSDTMDCDPSNDEAGSSEPVTASPVQGYVLPDHQDDLKLESNVPNVSNQGILGSEPAPRSTAQEPLFPRSQEGQESFVTVAVHRVINLDHERTAVSLSRGPTFSPEGTISEERPNSPPSDGSKQESREQSPSNGPEQDSTEQSPPAELLDSQQSQRRNVNGSPEYSWQESRVVQDWGSPAREPSSVADQRMAGAEVRRPRDHLMAGQLTLDQGPHKRAACTTIDPRSYAANVLPPSQTTPLPLPDVPGPHGNQKNRLAPIDNRKLPPIAELVGPPYAHPWRLRPNYPWVGYLPDPYESRRLKPQTLDGGPARLVQGPVQPLGPPMKPFDGAQAEAIAREQWRCLMSETARREAGAL